MRRRTGSFWLAALAAVLLLVAAGCGGGGGGAEGDGQVDHVRVGRGAPVARPGSRDRHDVRRTSSQHHGSAREARGRPRAGARPRRELGGRATTEPCHVPPARGRQWTNGDPVTAEDFEYSWKRTLSPELGRGLRVPVLRHRRRAGVQRLQKRLRRAARDTVGVEAVDDRTLEVTLTTPQPWFLAAGRPPLVPRRAPRDGRAVRRPVDGAGEHRHERPVQARPLGARLEIDLESGDEWRDADSVTLERVNGRIIAEGTTARSGLRGRRGRRARRGCIPPAEVAAPEGDRRSTTRVPGARHLLLRLQHRERHRREPAPRDVARDQPRGDRRQHHAGRPDPGDELHAAGDAGLRRRSTSTRHSSPEEATSRRRSSHGKVAEPGEERQPLPTTTRRATRRSRSRSRDVEAAGDQREIKQQEWAQFLEFLGPPPNQ